jgi:hypothetical protein
MTLCGWPHEKREASGSLAVTAEVLPATESLWATKELLF